MRIWDLTRLIISFCLYTKAWQQGHSPFSKLHHDTFILCSPSGNLLWTCEPQVTHQLYTRGTDFIKPVKMMGMLNIYGPTLVASDGEEARLYRKITGPSFNEKNHERVWIETLKQAGHMVNDWYGNAITTLHSDVSRGTLHVFSSVCLSHDIEWTKGRNQKDFMPKGHTLSWADAIDSVLNHAITIFTTPRFLLSKFLPSHRIQLIIPSRKFTFAISSKGVYCICRVGKLYEWTLWGDGRYPEAKERGRQFESRR